MCLKTDKNNAEPLPDPTHPLKTTLICDIAHFHDKKFGLISSK